MSFGYAHRIHEHLQDLGKVIESATPDLLRRPTMAGQIQGINGEFSGKVLMVKQPIIEVPAKPVNQDGCLLTFTLLEYRKGWSCKTTTSGIGPTDSSWVV